MEVDCSEGVLGAELNYDSARTLKNEMVHMSRKGKKRRDRMNRTHNSTMGRVLVAGIAGMIGFSMAMSGCVSYTNVPVPASAPAFKNANHMQSISVLTRALEAVINEHPAGGGAYAINLPTGTTPETFEKIIANLPAGATMPFEGMDVDMPTYHIGRVWIRASDAKVDVIYPFTGMDGVSNDQNVTIWLSGGVRSWRVHRRQHWAAGTIPTPPVYVPAWTDDGFVDEPNGPSSDQPEPTYEDAWLPEPESQPEVYVEPPVQDQVQTQEESIGGGDYVGNGYHQVPLKSDD